MAQQGAQPAAAAGPAIPFDAAAAMPRVFIRAEWRAFRALPPADTAPTVAQEGRAPEPDAAGPSSPSAAGSASDGISEELASPRRSSAPPPSPAATPTAAAEDYAPVAPVHMCRPRPVAAKKTLAPSLVRVLEALSEVPLRDPHRVELQDVECKGRLHGQLAHAATACGDIRGLWLRPRAEAGPRGTCRATVLFEDPEDAVRFRAAVADGRLDRIVGAAACASEGATRYCRRFLLDGICRDTTCTMIHVSGADAAVHVAAAALAPSAPQL
eukprot:TRINITY_DN2385_c0_g2_i1.p2 TRINITY_DN2385_c0_g2~~TRINITY_DN2385_c0_g2_i1.p2  ORF type:complete len:298 (+),score=96.90 TRINITY_DN2385_c0_g2_i1:85-894(+)